LDDNVAQSFLLARQRKGVKKRGQEKGSSLRLTHQTSTRSAIERIKARLETSEELRRQIDIIRRQIFGEKSQEETP
jgi:hypothetical protein